MTDHITPKLIEATNDLFKNGTNAEYLSNNHRKLEEILPKDDWRLREILKFRKNVQQGDIEKKNKYAKKIRQKLNKFGITDQYAQAFVLQEFQLRQAQLVKIANISLTAYRMNISPFKNINLQYKKTAEEVMLEINQETVNQYYQKYLYLTKGGLAYGYNSTKKQRND